MRDLAVYPDRSGTVPLLGRDTAPSEHEHDEMSVPTAIHFRREATAPVGAMSPRTESSHDVSKLKFPIGTVAAIVGTAIGVVTAQQIGQAGMKSDIRDILTRMEYQTRIDEAEQRANAVEVKAQNDAINELKRLTQMLQIQYGELSKQMVLRR